MDTIRITEIEPCLSMETLSPAKYKRACAKLERCYSKVEKDSPYRVFVRPSMSGYASGTYMWMKNGDLQILGYSVDVPDDFEAIREKAWNLFCSGKRVRNT
jgi:hypothetical protein